MLGCGGTDDDPREAAIVDSSCGAAVNCRGPCSTPSQDECFFVNSFSSCDRGWCSCTDEGQYRLRSLSPGRGGRIDNSCREEPFESPTCYFEGRPDNCKPNFYGPAYCECGADTIWRCTYACADAGVTD